jgi:magnesium transporter
MLSAAETAGGALQYLIGRTYQYTETVFLVDTKSQLLGAVPMKKLLAARSEQPLAEIAEHNYPTVLPDTDQEKVASLAILHAVDAVPVVSVEGKFLGIVPPQALLEVLRHEHVEDLHRLAGIRHEGIRARKALEAPPTRRARDRLPWLLVGLVGSMLATLVVAWFEQALQSRVAIAFFVPGIVYLADAIGTQTETIAVRGLSLSHMPLRRLIAQELRTGLLIGFTLGLLTIPVVWLGFGDVKLALAVASALVIAGALATTIGLVFPWALSHLGRDPAFGSGPIATIVQDVLSLFVYFVVVTLIVL